MNVEQLISKLSQFPQNLTVMVSGYEYGVKEEFEVDVKTVEINYHEGRYGGKHEVVDYGEPSGDYETKQAVIISR
jgi:hypothetical protein